VASRADGEFALVFMASEFALDRHMRTFGKGAGEIGQFPEVHASMPLGARSQDPASFFLDVLVASEKIAMLVALPHRSSPHHGEAHRSRSAKPFAPSVERVLRKPLFLTELLHGQSAALLLGEPDTPLLRSWWPPSPRQRFQSWDRYEALSALWEEGSSQPQLRWQAIACLDAHSVVDGASQLLLAGAKASGLLRAAGRCRHGRNSACGRRWFEIRGRLGQ
jgi:hypothetical protein